MAKSACSIKYYWIITYRTGFNFNYVGYAISYDYNDNGVSNKLQGYQVMCGTISRTLMGKTIKRTPIKYYKAVFTLLYGTNFRF